MYYLVYTIPNFSILADMDKETVQSLGLNPLPRSKSLQEMAYESLKTGILAGRLIPGKKYGELELARELGISRTPVREALLKLEAENLVCFNPGRGISVKYFSKKDLEDLTELRWLIEEAAVTKIVGCLSTDQIERVENILAEQEECVRGNYDESIFLEIDRKFHLSLIEASGNKFMIQTYNSIRDYFAMTFRGALSKKGRVIEVLREHKLIVKALSEAKVDMAIDAVRTHLINSKSIAMSYHDTYANNRATPGAVVDEDTEFDSRNQR
jgi:DNA-binding GntR family transcriptional regulator